MRHDESWLWLYLAVLVGQADGEVFIPDAALVTAEKTQIIFRQDVERGGTGRASPPTLPSETRRGRSSLST